MFYSETITKKFASLNVSLLKSFVDFKLIPFLSEPHARKWALSLN